MTTANGAAANSRADQRVVRVSDYEVAVAQLQLAIDAKLGREPDPILVKIANAR